MRPMSKFEKKFGKYAIHNLSTILILCYAVGYLIEAAFPSLKYYLTLNPYLVLHGQVWRLVSWVLIPPPTGNIFMVMIMLYFYWSIGTTLERTWGTYRYNVYMFSGMLFTILGAFVLMGYHYIIIGAELSALGSTAAAIQFQALSIYFSTYYINMSIFLAFAATFPDVQVLLMFIIPIKVKWLGIVYGVVLLWDFFITGNLAGRVAMLFSLLNFIVFFVTSRKSVMSPKQIHRKQEFKKAVHKAPAITKHKCAICGRTNETNPELEFRFCSKCNGNYEYCQDHLFTHVHVGSGS